MTPVPAYLKKVKHYWTSDNSFISLMLMLLFIVFVLPIIVSRESDTDMLQNIFLVGLFIVGVFSAKESVHFWLSIILVSIHVLLRIIRFTDNPFQFLELERIVIILNLGVFILINFKLLFRDQEANVYRIVGAVNVYLSVALMATFAFELIHLHFGTSIAGNLELRGDDSDFAEFMYFSLVSISTVGFGDVHPDNIQAKMISSFVSVFGILYPAIVIAKLVSISTKRN
ncbi:potassium channel family protein [Mongoliitalea lutea]|uniref:Potassium channel domain-containing protein n=1 Tax=Mongoliitalea lutea TaxID=849756 RepID=A0A8J3D0P2_9BACT|nr:potassium channel family protein [Mongoliitalea lutea]GHB48686.1 hypothetical protein GCM10008106_31910 [Mongoliitalea lutea]